MPTCAVVTAKFENYVARDTESHGMLLRYAYPPYPVGWMSKEVLRDYVEADDPVTGKPLMQEMVHALTLPLTDDEKNPKVAQRPKRPRLLKKDTIENYKKMFIENGWTDGMPIEIPTEEKVEEMLTGTDHAPDEIVGMMSVTTHEERYTYTVEKVAVNAVMAGARPEHFPVILALAASQEPSMPSSTTSFGRMVIVNGPIRNQIAINCGSGAFSPFNFANAVIGRAYTLMSFNFGNARINENFTATFGNVTNYNNMFAGENEEESPWEPLHVEKGFGPEESTVSLFRGWNVNHLGMSIGGMRYSDRMLEVVNGLKSMLPGGTFVMDPLVAKNLKDQEGFRTKEEFRQWLFERLNKPDGPFMRPPSLNMVVVGGEWNPMFTTTDFVYTQTVSIDKWIPENGIRMDAKPIRMPSPVTCKDGTCGIR
ncbi:MAG: hypothetical protein P8Y80_06005 [Acidobacteriota bacterium]